MYDIVQIVLGMKQ